MIILRHFVYLYIILVKQINVMQKQEYKIHIIGAGISGLIAAQVLEKHGYYPVILEQSKSIGGRVQSDVIDGYTLDHGFQVLLTAYPMAQRYLDYDELILQKFLPGAVIFDNGSIQKIGDPFRSVSLLWPTIISNAASFNDKLKIFQLTNSLKAKSIDKIFEEEEKTTLEYLKEYGFSEKVIDHFFTPFFSGIFLETVLKTSSRMFQFVYKMFNEGYAAIPKAGIQAIPDQLGAALQHTIIQYNTAVKRVEEGKIILADGTVLESHFTIIATAPSSLIQNLNNQETVWKSCDTLYFETNEPVISQALIGLVTESKSLINNICYPTNFGDSPTTTGHLLSVTVVKAHNYDEETLVAIVEKELQEYCGIQTNRFIRCYRIPKALPDLKNVQYSMSPTETNILPRVYLAGDHMLNGSLNGAMLSGEMAARGVIEALENGLVIGNLTSEYR